MAVLAWTKQGRVAGELANGPSYVFRGIPYARPPLGRLRFRAPEAPEAWQGVREAVRFGAAAPQDKGLATDIGDRSEDCLHLNVWTPAVDRGRRPVMVWIHGGAFTSGSSAQELYDGAELAARGGVVVVTLNYRLGVFGFGYLRRALSADLPANVGLLDQLAALEWVRDNIAEFGGDPANVTLFGESAGAMSVSVLLSAARARGLFRRAIAQSGAAHHVLSPDQGSHVADAFVAALGSAERAWSASAEELVVAQRACQAQYVLRGPRGRLLRQKGFSLLPVVDGELLTEDPLTAIAAGAARDRELLIGVTLHEWNYFLFLNEPDKRDIDEAALRKIFEARLPGLGQRAIDFYRGLLGHDQPAWSIYSALESDRSFRMPALRLSDAHAADGGKTFAYLFEFRSSLFKGALGACHALEIPFVFGTLSTGFGRALTGATEDAIALSYRMQDAWLAFAKSGNPSCESLGAWPEYDVRDHTTQRLGTRCSLAAGPLDSFRPFWETLI
ncbi:MAG TPA: carboxylesterase family protein [Polyangiales bacterium]|nr:carboxylesterase family protein [Polyangiales bacterium]